jgi:hypothetical protein
MTPHALVDARYAGARADPNSGVAFVTFHPDLIDRMNLVRKFDRLLRFVLNA